MSKTPVLKWTLGTAEDISRNYREPFVSRVWFDETGDIIRATDMPENYKLSDQERKASWYSVYGYSKEDGASYCVGDFATKREATGLIVELKSIQQ